MSSIAKKLFQANFATSSCLVSWFSGCVKVLKIHKTEKFLEWSSGCVQMRSKVAFDTEKDTKLWNQKKFRENRQNSFLMSNLPEQNCISSVLSGFVMDDKVLLLLLLVYINNQYYVLTPPHTHTWDYRGKITKIWIRLLSEKDHLQLLKDFSF